MNLHVEEGFAEVAAPTVSSCLAVIERNTNGRVPMKDGVYLGGYNDNVFGFYSGFRSVELISLLGQLGL